MHTFTTSITGVLAGAAPGLATALVARTVTAGMVSASEEGRGGDRGGGGGDDGDGGGMGTGCGDGGSGNGGCDGCNSGVSGGVGSRLLCRWYHECPDPQLSLSVFLCGPDTPVQARPTTRAWLVEASNLGRLPHTSTLGQPKFGAPCERVQHLLL